MANAYKNAGSVTVSTTATGTSILTATTETLVKELRVTNVGTTDQTVKVYVDSVSDYHLGHDVTIPAGASVNFVDNVVVLENTDIIRVSGSATTFNVFVSYVEIT